MQPGCSVSRGARGFIIQMRSELAGGLAAGVERQESELLLYGTQKICGQEAGLTRQGDQQAEGPAAPTPAVCRTRVAARGTASPRASCTQPRPPEKPPWRPRPAIRRPENHSTVPALGTHLGPCLREGAAPRREQRRAACSPGHPECAHRDHPPGHCGTAAGSTFSENAASPGQRVCS